MLFDRANALQEIIDFLGKARHAVNRNFKRVEPMENVFEFGADLQDLVFNLGYVGLDDRYFSLDFQDILGKSGKSPSRSAPQADQIVRRKILACT